MSTSCVTAAVSVGHGRYGAMVTVSSPTALPRKKLLAVACRATPPPSYSQPGARRASELGARVDSAPTWDAQRNVARHSRRLALHVGRAAECGSALASTRPHVGRAAECGSALASTRPPRGTRSGMWLDGRRARPPRGTRSGSWRDGARWLDGRRARPPAWDAQRNMVRASAVLPVPDGPVINTSTSRSDTSDACCSTRDSARSARPVARSETGPAPLGCGRRDWAP